MAVLRSLVTTLGMNSTQYRADLKRAGKSTDSFHKVVKKGANSSIVAYGAMAKQASTAGLALATAATVAMVAIGKETDQLYLLSEQTRMGFEDFQALAYATDRYGISAEKMADISKDVTDKLGDFLATGAGPFSDFFENVAPKVGLTADALQGLSGPDVLQAVKNAMDAANISMEEQVFYLEAIGSDASKLMPLLANGGKLQKEMASEFERSNKAISQQDAEKLRKMNVAFDGMARAAAAAAATITAKLSPAIIGLSNILEQAFSPEDASARIEASLASMDAGIKAKRIEIQAIQDMTPQQAYKATGTSYGLKTQAGIEAQKNTALSAENTKLAALIQQRAELQAQLDELNGPIIPDEQPPLEIKTQTQPPAGGLTPEELARQAELAEQWLVQLQERMMTEEALILSREAQEIARAEREIASAETRKQALILIEQNKTKEIAAIRAREDAAQKQQQSMQLSASASLFGSMADITGAFAGEQSGAYKAMFAVSKAFSIAESIIAIQTGIAKAAANPFPANIAAMASVAAATMSIVSTITGTSMQGVAHAGIDSVPREGTWLLDGGERVLSKNQNSDLTSYLDGNKNNQSQASGVVVNLIDQAGVNTQVEESDDDLGRKVIDIVLMDQRTGGEMTSGYQGMWGLNRKGQF